MKSIFILLLAFCAFAVNADESDDKTVASAQIGISDWSWEKSGFGVIMMADITITNNSDWAVKDIQIRTAAFGSSGTDLGHNDETIYEIVPAHSAKKFSAVNMGFIDAQAAHASMGISDFDFCQPHLSLEEIKSAKVAAEKIAATNAILAKAAAEQRRKAGETAALKFNQDQAAKGDAYGLLRMGERYRDGNGVDKDLSKAKDYFEKSAAAGNSDAMLALKKLSDSNP